MRSAIPWLRRFTLVVAGLCATATLLIYGYRAWHWPGHADFHIYHRAAGQALAGDWAGVYAYQQGGDTPFRYAPPTLLLFAPFAPLPLPAARLAWLLVQCACFGAAFLLLRRALRPTGRDSTWIAATAFLSVLRFILDCLAIAQVTSAMLLGLAASVVAWQRGRARAAGAWLAVPALFKIAPGMGLFLLARRLGPRALLGAALLAGAGAAMIALWALARPAPGLGLPLWLDWARVVAADSSYFDSSHYGSQSVKSVLLRAAAAGWLSRDAAGAIHLVLLTATCAAIASFWWLRRPATPRSRGLFFSLGIFATLWFLPETFKYSLPMLAIPVAFLLAGPTGWLERAALVFGALTLSLAGLDVVGETLFFALQRASVPALAMIGLGAACWRRAFLESGPA